MAKVFTVSVPNNSRLKDFILVNGKNPTFKYDKTTKRFIATLQSERDYFILSLDSYHSLLRKASWFWMNMLFFFLSFIGIFDSPDRRKYYYDFEAKINLHEGENSVLVSEIRDREKVVSLETMNPYEIEKNEKVYDKRIKKRKICLGLIKALLIIVGLIIAAAIIIIINS